jgi:hypothetical protein
MTLVGVSIEEFRLHPDSYPYDQGMAVARYEPIDPLGQHPCMSAEKPPREEEYAKQKDLSRRP